MCYVSDNSGSGGDGGGGEMMVKVGVVVNERGSVNTITCKYN